jgi:hypothetical protein
LPEVEAEADDSGQAPDEHEGEPQRAAQLEQKRGRSRRRVVSHPALCSSSKNALRSLLAYRLPRDRQADSSVVQDKRAFGAAMQHWAKLNRTKG